MCALRLADNQFSVYPAYCSKAAGMGYSTPATLMRMSKFKNGWMDGYIRPNVLFLNFFFTSSWWVVGRYPSTLCWSSTMDRWSRLSIYLAHCLSLLIASSSETENVSVSFYKLIKIICRLKVAIKKLDFSSCMHLDKQWHLKKNKNKKGQVAYVLSVRQRPGLSLCLSPRVMRGSGAARFDVRYRTITTLLWAYTTGKCVHAHAQHLHRHRTT